MPSHEQLLRNAAALAQSLAALPKYSQEDFKQATFTITRLNAIAVEALNDRTSDHLVFRLLRSAEELLRVFENEEISSWELIGLKALTYNNFGCYFQSKGKSLAALEYLQKTLEVEQAAGASDTSIATTLLNLTAVLSKLGRHEDALEFAQNAMNLLGRLGSQINSSDIKLNSLVSTAYYNYAIELESLGRPQEAKRYYDRAYTNALNSLGVAHSKTRKYKEKLDKSSGRNDRQPTNKTAVETGSSNLSTESRALVVIGQFYK